MKRVTVVFDDEALYRAVKVEAARTGRTVKEVVTEALRTWLGSEPRLTDDKAERLRQVLEDAARLRAKQKPSETSIVDEIHAMREERLDAIEGH